MFFSKILNSSLLCLCLASSLTQASAGKPQAEAAKTVPVVTPAAPAVAPVENQATPTCHFDISKGFTHVAEVALPAVVNVATTQVIEAKDNDEILFKDEAADLLFHYLILLSAKGYSLEDIKKVLQLRHAK